MAPPLGQSLNQAEAALEDGELEDALRFAELALAADPRSQGALDVKANALAELGDFEQADAIFERLMGMAPDEPAYAVSAADVLIRQPGDDRERVEAGLELLDRTWPKVKADPELSSEVQLLRGVALNQLGELEDALDAFARVLDVDPEHPTAHLERAVTLFELTRFDEAKKALERLTRDVPDEPTAWHYLGLIAERRRDDAERFFRKARELDPECFPPPVRLGGEAFDAAVKEAIESLPEHSREHLSNVVIDVEPIPSDEELKEGDISPAILGIFRGTPIDERSPVDAHHHETARITLYQRNLERFATTREELLEQIRITVLHEVGHLLGLDEDELYERGLD